MAKQKLFSFLLLFLLKLVSVCAQQHKHEIQRLFVFGDSYADTGNHKINTQPSWKEPYGITFPGKPTGRWSDGRLMTDFFASLGRIRSPVPYQWRKINPQILQYGMNFAYGGTGVYTNTITTAPNITAQITLFQSLINEGVYTPIDIQSSIALVSLAGNDYTFYKLMNGTKPDIGTFISSVIHLLSENLKQLQNIGIKKIAVTNLGPLGCLPRNAIPFPKLHCSDNTTKVSDTHNLLLEKAVKKLNGNGFSVAIVDLHKAFLSVIGGQGQHKFERPLVACCVAKGEGYKCGSVDASGSKMYTLCSDPKASLFWDDVHPSQEGWAATAPFLQAALDRLLSA